MAKNRRPKPKSCNTCGAHTDMFMCANCAAELQSLLVGASGAHSQPGIVWYINRLMEQAYGQARLGAIDSAHGGNDGYGLLVDDRATELLTRIRVALGDWVARLDGLSATWGNENGPVVSLLPRGRNGHSEPLETRYALWLSRHMKAIRKQQDSKQLYDQLAGYAKDAWRIINRPADVCCGPCTELIRNFNKSSMTCGVLEPCGTMLYADEHANTVTCPRCKSKYDVESLREAMRDKLKDMLFTGAELRRLMETRLNDRMPKATFYRLIADGRLEPRVVTVDRVPLFTYEDVCEAREKPKPKVRLKGGV